MTLLLPPIRMYIYSHVTHNDRRRGESLSGETTDKHNITRKMNRSYFCSNICRKSWEFALTNFAGMSSLGMRAPAPVAQVPSGAAKLTLRLATILSEHDVTQETQALLGDAGYTSLALFSALGHDHLTFAEALTDLGVDPALGGTREERSKMRLEKTRLTAAFDMARVRGEVETRESAQRAATFQPVRISDQDYLMARRAYETNFHRLEDEVAPSKPYFERLIEMLSTCYTAEELTTVTTVQQETEGSSGLGSETDARGYVRITTKTLAVPMPKTSELYRLRLRTQAYAYNYLKMRFSNVPALASITPQRFQEFQEYLFGPDVWGMCTRDENGRVSSTPTILQVQNYEREIRKDVAKRMNNGQDWWSATQDATACPRLLQIHFLSPVAKDHRSSVTAPGVATAASSSSGTGGGGGQKRAIEDRQEPSAKSAANRQKRQKQKDKVKALKDAVRGAAGFPPPLAIADAQRPPKGGGKAGGKGGKTAGKVDRFPAGAHRTTAAPESKGLCIPFNLASCTRQGCFWAHVCWWCLEAHSGATCPKKVIGQ